MEKPGGLVNTILPSKLNTPSRLVRISLLSAMNRLSDSLNYMLNDHESISSIFALLVQEAMGYGDDYGDIGDAVEYAIAHPRCPDKDLIYNACSNVSEEIYQQITTHLPEFGNKRYRGQYTFNLGENADVFIRISESVING